MSRSLDVHLVVPTRGERPELLDISMQSLLGQSYPIRITIVTPVSAVAAMTARYGDVGAVTVVAERGAGLAAAINQAWEEDGWASDFTAWLGDDDALPPTSVEDAVAVLENKPAAVMVHGRCLLIDDAGNPLSVVRNGRAASLLVGYGMNLIAQPGCVFRTSTLKRVGGLESSLRYAMDVDLYARLRRLGPVATTNRQLGVFRIHPSGLSTAGKREAAAEARRAMRAAHLGLGDIVLDAVAVPTTRLVERITRRLRPAPTAYWRPRV